MNAKTFSLALGQIDDKYIVKAISYQPRHKSHGWVKWGAIAACLCFVIVGAFVMRHVDNVTHPAHRPNSTYIQENVSIATVYHTVHGKTTELVIKGQALEDLRDWANDLTYSLTAENGSIAPDNVENAEIFEVVLEEGDYPGFSYIICGEDNCYLLIEGYWYSVTNPSNPPVINTQTENTDTVQFHGDIFNKSNLSQETLKWLEWYNGLSESEQLSISSIPADLYKLCGYAEVENGETIARDNFSIASSALFAGNYVSSEKTYMIEHEKHYLMYSMNWTPTGQSVHIGFMHKENNTMYLLDGVEGGSAAGTINTVNVPSGEYYVIVFAASDNTEPFSINATCEWTE